MKILIIRLSSMGDIVITEPVVRRLAEFYPQAEIFYLVKPQFQEIVKSFPEAIRIIEWTNDLAGLLEMRKQKYDLVIDLHNKPNTALIRLFCRAKRLVVYDKQRSLRQKIIKKQTDEQVKSTLDLYFSVLRKMVIVPKKTRPVLKPNGSAKEILQKYNLTRNKYILIFPEATSFTKCWLPEYFAELIDLVGQELQVIIAGNESELTDRLRRLAKSDFIDLMGKTSLKQLISLIAGSKAVIANDSGPAHLAAALAKPQVTIFGGTSPRLGFAPMNPKGVIISHDLPCSPCSLHGSDKCRLEHFNCMKMILPKDVYEMLLTIIES